MGTRRRFLIFRKLEQILSCVLISLFFMISGTIRIILLIKSALEKYLRILRVCEGTVSISVLVWKLLVS